MGETEEKTPRDMVRDQKICSALTFFEILLELEEPSGHGKEKELVGDLMDGMPGFRTAFARDLMYEEVYRSLDNPYGWYAALSDLSEYLHEAEEFPTMRIPVRYALSVLSDDLVKADSIHREMDGNSPDAGRKDSLGKEGEVRKAISKKVWRLVHEAESLG